MLTDNADNAVCLNGFPTLNSRCFERNFRRTLTKIPQTIGTLLYLYHRVHVQGVTRGNNVNVRGNRFSTLRRQMGCVSRFFLLLLLAYIYKKYIALYIDLRPQWSSSLKHFNTFSHISCLRRLSDKNMNGLRNLRLVLGQKHWKQ